MIEKRYVIEEIGNMFRVLKDNEPLTTKFENCDKQDVTNLIAELNEVHEEKKELQFQYNLLREQANEFHRGARENANRVGQLEKENKELREQLKDCTEKAKEEIRKQREENAIRWANIGR